MGQGNVCVNGPYEGLFYVNNDYITVYRRRGTWEDGDEWKNGNEIDYSELSGGGWELDEAESDLRIDEMIDWLCQSIRKRFPRFKYADKWIKTGAYGYYERHAILENKLFYVCLEDNQWSTAVELIQKEDDYGDSMEGLQKKHFQRYLNGIRDALFEQFDTLGTYAGAWTSGRISRKDYVARSITASSKECSELTIGG